jgi:hypothetical protein
MTKKVTSFKLDDRHFEIIDTKSKEFGIGKSEFLRNILDSYQKVQLYSSEGDESQETHNARNLNYNELTVSILKALQREFDDTINTKKPISSIRGFSKKYDFKPTVVKSTLNQFVRNEIMTVEKTKQGKEQFLWTYKGIVVFPEFAPVSTNDDSLISGSAVNALEVILGEYDDVVNYLSQTLNIDEVMANSTIRFFLASYKWYFNWLRELVFPITGVNTDLDVSYYRTQMIDYLLMLSTNYGNSWEDWKTKRALDLKLISQKILEYKANEGNLT